MNFKIFPEGRWDESKLDHVPVLSCFKPKHLGSSPLTIYPLMFVFVAWVLCVVGLGDSAGAGKGRRT
jgi:hypothetical protein